MSGIDCRQAETLVARYIKHTLSTDELEEFLVEIEQIHAQHRQPQRNEPRHSHVRQKVRTHTKPGERDNRGPERAGKPQSFFLSAEPLGYRRQKRSEHRAGGTGGMPGRERAEFVGRHALSNQLVFKAASRLPPRRKVAGISRRGNQPHSRSAPGDLDDVDQEHCPYTDKNERQHKADHRLSLRAGGYQQQRRRANRRR